MSNQSDVNVSEDKNDFESSLKELERIVEKLGDSKLSLENMVNLYQRGIKLKDECLQQISQVKLKIKEIESSQE